MRSATNKFDVAILGSGIGGCELACLLARNGVSVLVIDAASHPRFAVGESTIPETSQLLSLMAKEFDVPEFDELGLGSPDGIRKSIGTTCGIKRAFGFAYHKFDQDHQPNESLLFGNVWRDENHLFRQDVDAHLMRVAIKYGATVLQSTQVKRVELQSEGVVLHTSAGVFHAEFLADGSGHNSFLANQLQLREEPCRFTHHSRTIFTHMIGVTPFEDLTKSNKSVPWSKTTLHHIFERGWLWVIPFNNWEGSTNPIVSVGLQLDPRHYPDRPDLSPEDEFFDFLNHLPSVKPQFASAKPVRPWVRTGRLQYSSRASVGARYCLLSHASGFIDPLFSRGMICTSEINRALGSALIKAVQDRDFSSERFEHIEALHRRNLSFADRLVNASAISWSNFDLWNAWWRIWVAGLGCVESNLGGYLLFQNMPEMKRQQIADPLFSPFEEPGYREFFDRAEAVMLEFEKGQRSASTASDAIFKELREFQFAMNLKNLSKSHVWAIKNPQSRDLFIGKDSLHQRWMRRESDPGL